MDESSPKECSGNVVGAFAHSLGHTVIQAPIDGVREVVNKLASKDVIPKVELVKEPEKAEYGSLNWNAQQLGKGVGFVASFFIIGRLLPFRK